MHDTTQGNAMTEIALAMAMGFFSVMVLTMMSMGVGLGQKRAMDTIILAPPAPQSAAADSGAKIPAEPLLTVVIPVYNEIKTLEVVIERVLHVGMPVEIIMVDDGSTDGSRELMDRLACSSFELPWRHSHPRRAGSWSSNQSHPLWL